MLKQVYSLLASWTVCKVKAKYCIFPCISLICGGTSDYMGNKVIVEAMGNTEI